MLIALTPLSASFAVAVKLTFSPVAGGSGDMITKTKGGSKSTFDSLGREKPAAPEVSFAAAHTKL